MSIVAPSGRAPSFAHLRQNTAPLPRFSAQQVQKEPNRSMMALYQKTLSTSPQGGAPFYRFAPHQAYQESPSSKPPCGLH
jgi:hypothetical protein